MEIWLLMNECVIKGMDVAITERVSAHSTRQKALDALAAIVDEYGDRLHEDESSIYVHPSPAFESDEYYIDVVEVDSDER